MVLIKVLEEQSEGFDSVVVVTAQHRQMFGSSVRRFSNYTGIMI